MNVHQLRGQGRSALILGVGIVIGVIAFALLPSDREFSKLTMTDVQHYLRELPGVDLVLPASVPDNYVWIGPTDFSSTSGNGVDSRSSVFWPDSVRQDPVVRVCAEVAGSHACPVSDMSLTRDWNGLQVVITASGGAAGGDGLNFWRTVELVGSGSARWLR